MAIDDNTLYGLTGAQVKELPERIEAVKGKAKVLTTADYNWPTSNPDGIALWKLDTGIYKTAEGVKQYRTTDNNDSLQRFIIVHNNGYQTAFLLIRGSDGSMKYYDVQVSTGVLRTMAYIGAPVDALGSTSSVSALSANQGRVLKDLIDSIAIRGAGAPTTSTVGQVGTLYEDTTNGDLYICTDATNPYIWEEVGAGGGGPTVVQTTGTSTTDVMSQAAVTNMIAPKSSTDAIWVNNPKQGYTLPSSLPAYSVTLNASNTAGGASATSAIAINGTASGHSAISIGVTSSATQRGSIALGRGASATSVGEMNIGTNDTTAGYNSSSYRLLTGLYDPQSDHDAATKGYVDNSLLGKQDALTAGDGITIADESGSLVISTTVAEPDEFTSNEWNALWS